MSVAPDRDGAPQIELTQTFVNPTGAKGYWSVGWSLQNQGADSLRVLSVRVPHGQFRAEEHRFGPMLDLAPGQKTEFTISIGCHEPSGLVTENAFLIFHVVRLDEQWRIFVRIRVSAGNDGRPETKVESITTQRLGFSGVAT
jgi:hypothetical protein